MCWHLTGLWTRKNRLKHTHLTVCEIIELPLLLYLMQIFAIASMSSVHLAKHIFFTFLISINMQQFIQNLQEKNILFGIHLSIHFFVYGLVAFTPAPWLVRF